MIFGVNGKVNAYKLFFLYRLICPFITPLIHGRVTSNFQLWSLKKELPVDEVSIDIYPLFTVGLRSNWFL